MAASPAEVPDRCRGWLGALRHTQVSLRGFTEVRLLVVCWMNGDTSHGFCWHTFCVSRYNSFLCCAQWNSKNKKKVNRYLGDLLNLGGALGFVSFFFLNQVNFKRGQNPQVNENFWRLYLSPNHMSGYKTSDQLKGIKHRVETLTSQFGGRLKSN